MGRKFSTVHVFPGFCKLAPIFLSSPPRIWIDAPGSRRRIFSAVLGRASRCSSGFLGNLSRCSCANILGNLSRCPCGIFFGNLSLHFCVHFLGNPSQSPTLPFNTLASDSRTHPSPLLEQLNRHLACCWHCSFFHGSWGPIPGCFSSRVLGSHLRLFFFHVHLAHVHHTFCSLPGWELARVVPIFPRFLAMFLCQSSR